MISRFYAQTCFKTSASSVFSTEVRYVRFKDIKYLQINNIYLKNNKNKMKLKIKIKKYLWNNRNVVFHFSSNENIPFSFI